MRQRIVITGGTSGIGAAVARAFAEQGAAVIATGLTGDETKRFAAQLPQVEVRRLDVTDAASVHRLVEELRGLDVLVNCAGMILRDGAEFEPDGFQQVVNVNLHGAMRMCLACRDLLAEQGGCIVNIASMLSFFGSGFAPAYSASKGGVVQLTKSLAIAWAADNIRVNAVAPGWIQTALTAPLAADEQRSDAILRRTPLGRWGKPEDVAGAVLFLCSPAAEFITGVVLPVDGGYSIA